jgi:uncharacterized protein (DUF1330 family)
MPAYVVIITNRAADAADLEKYRALSPLAPVDKVEIVAARGSPFEALEGGPAEGVVILRFPQMSDALAWYRSEEYQTALKHRLASGDYRAVVVEGAI